jgi:Cof subfamily protein (haloacid dehalogenase superfamily)
MKLRLVAFDLDGTLLKDDKTISPKTRETLARARDAGVLLVPVTGRLFDTMPREVRELPGLAYAITVNGAEVFDVAAKRVLREAVFSRAEAERMMDYMAALPAIRGCYQAGNGWMSPEDFARIDEFSALPRQDEFLRMIYRPLENMRAKLLDAGSIQKLQVYFRTVAEKDRFLAEMLKAFPDYAVSTSIPNNIEVNALGATKGAALLFLCEQLGIRREDCMALGDGTNDTSMIEAAGIGVAMGNAAPEVKAAANVITKTNEEDGLAEAILAYL